MLGPFSRSAVNYNAGCKTAMSNVIMSLAVMFTLLFLTPLFHYTPMVVLSAIIMSAMLGLIDYPAAIHLWQVDKVDFCVCIGAYLGVVFGSIEIGLVVAVRCNVAHCLLLYLSFAYYLFLAICFLVLCGFRLRYRFCVSCCSLRGRGRRCSGTYPTP